MKKASIFIIALAGIFASCQQNQQQKETIDSAATQVTETSPQQTCYMQVIKRDTITLSLKQVGTALTGQLAYDNFEKDSSSGAVSGVMRGDTLVLEYSFQSEGMQTVSEVAFLKKGNKLIQSAGDMEERDQKMRYKNLKEVKFDEQSAVLSQVDCPPAG